MAVAVIEIGQTDSFMIEGLIYISQQNFFFLVLQFAKKSLNVTTKQKNFYLRLAKCRRRLQQKTKDNKNKTKQENQITFQYTKQMSMMQGVQSYLKGMKFQKKVETI